MHIRAVAVVLAGVIGLLAWVGGGGSAQAVTLDVRGGILFGAKGLNLGGKFFDVEFIDRSCAAIFAGCDSNSDFNFANEDTVIAAGVALRDQVVVNSGGFLFDSNVGLTNGCRESISFCAIVIPRSVSGTNVFSLAMFNFSFTNTISIFSSQAAENFAAANDRVYARFTPVPVPAALPLLLGALGLLALVGRRRRG